MAVTAKQLGSRIRRCREARGWSAQELTFEVGTRLPRSERISDETMRKIELGISPRSGVSPVLVAAIADALEVEVESLSPEVDEEQRRIAALLNRTTDPDRVKSLRSARSHSRCSTILPAQSQLPVSFSLV